MKYITIALMAITVLLTGSIALAQEIPVHAQAQSVESAELTTEIQSQSSTTTTKPKQATKKKKTKKKATKKQTKAKNTNAKKEVKPKKTTKKTSTKKPKKSKSISTNTTSDVERANLGTTKDTLKVEQPDALGQLINSGTIDLQAQSTEDPVPRKTARKGLAVVGISGFSGLGLMLLLKKFFPH
ncbi:MAG: Membrane protease subunit, stomatin/prohibitin family [Candidatus Doudnabacteria bacterium Gr01-1014_77]|uniref:Membrane protease subunit, stomatin/prohibitin family n=1 Tax=Candidatus Doudnabacteria bacterium Gr01-1014_77 TaxID=2017133 RepID=A0A554JEB3_9BACT|nr:MAG: Membrane protease subunit, stomatin/prohibitin family [Candidatus Doudnabacteria bacterium Gr01-1014_77]